MRLCRPNRRGRGRRSPPARIGGRDRGPRGAPRAGGLPTGRRGAGVASASCVVVSTSWLTLFSYLRSRRSALASTASQNPFLHRNCPTLLRTAPSSPHGADQPNSLRNAARAVKPASITPARVHVISRSWCSKSARCCAISARTSANSVLSQIGPHLGPHFRKSRLHLGPHFRELGLHFRKSRLRPGLQRYELAAQFGELGA